MNPDLTTALRELAAGEATEPPGLADRALARARSRTRRRGAAAVLGAAVAVVLVVGAVLTSLPGAEDRANPAPPATGAPSVLDRPRVNVLLIGSDAAPDRIGTRPDTVIVGSVDTRTGATALFGLPRSLEHMPFRPGTPQARAFPEGFACPEAGSGHDCLLNAVWQWAETGGAKFYRESVNPGLTATTEVVEQATGLTVDETVVVTMKGLQRLVDAVGGVDLTVRERLPIGGNSENPHAGTWLEKGPQHLDGHQALWYARSRWSTDDYSRMARQQCLLTALVDQVDGADLARAWPRLLGALRDDLRTTIRPADLPGWVTLAGRMKEGGVTQVGLGDDSRVHPDFPRMRTVVRETLAGNAVAGTPYGRTC